MMRLSCMMLIAVTAAAQPPAAQQPPTFKSGTQVVQVDVRVFDKNGRFVTNLTPADFEIKEDGVVQPIATLTLVGGEPSNPLNLTSNPEPSNQTLNPEPPNPEPRRSPSTWIFVFDTLHLTPGGLHNTQQAVVDFLRDRFHDGDIGGIVVNGKMANNRLTSVREELVKAAEDIRLPDSAFQYKNEMTRQWPRIQDEFEAWRITENDADALAQAVRRACSDDPNACARVPPDGQIQSKARQIVDTAQAASNLTLKIVQGLSNGLARMTGPKTVVFLSEGFLIQGIEGELKNVTALANRAGAHFYTVDARGLNKGTAGASIIDEPASFDSAGPSVHFDMQEDGTNALAVDTGGMAIRNENNFGRALDVIQRDAGTYYVVGYTPSNQTFDGKFRKIDVSVKRAGLKVRARRGYLALEPTRLLRPTPITSAPPRPGSEVAQPRSEVAPPGSEISPPGSEVGTPGSEVAGSGVHSSSNVPKSTSETPAPGSEVGGAGSEVGAEVGGAGSEVGGAASSAADSLRSVIESHGLVQELQSAERLAPATGDDLAGKGWAAYQRGDVENAARYLGQAAKSADVHPWVRYALGLAHLALAQYPEAVREWEAVRRAAPEFEPVYFNLADGYLLQKDDDSALDVLRAAQKRWPSDSEVWNASGVVEVRRGAVDAAIKSFTRATTADPHDSLGFFNLAKAYQMRAAQSQRFDSTLQKWTGGEGDNQKAAEYYTKYVQMGGPFVQQAKEALQVLNWKSENP